MLVFAHRGAPPRGVRANSLNAFTLAADAGWGIESDARISRDGQVVLQHDPVEWRAGVSAPAVMRARFLERMRVPRLAQLLSLPRQPPVCLDLKRVSAFAAVATLIREHDAANRVWLVHADLDRLSGWHALAPDLQLVHEAPAHELDGVDQRRYVSRLLAAGVRVQNTSVSWWTSGRVAQLHDRGLTCFGSLENTASGLARAVELGIDGVCTDRLDLAAEI